MDDMILPANAALSATSRLLVEKAVGNSMKFRTLAVMTGCVAAAAILMLSHPVTAFGQPPAQGKQGPGAAPADVTFDRLLNAKKEPQNWMSYSGDGMSQRHSQLSQITTA